MKIKRSLIALPIIMLLTSFMLGGCLNITINTKPSGSKEEVAENITDADTGELSKDDLLKKVMESNTFDDLMGIYGQVAYDHRAIRSDGSEDAYSIYKDKTRYVQDNSTQVIIIEGEEVYGYRKDQDAPFRTLFTDGAFDEYMEGINYESFFFWNDSEKITDWKTIDDGMWFVETDSPADALAANLVIFGYDSDEVDRLASEYIIDPDTLAIIENKTYLVINGEKQFYSEQIFHPDCEEYEVDPQITEGVFGDDNRTLTIITDAGSDNEKEYTQTVTKGSIIFVEPNDDYFTAVYYDADCYDRAQGIDRTKDQTLYLKRRVDYSDEKNWAYYAEGKKKDADLFLIAPTVDTQDEFCMSMDDEKTKANFLGALNMERGIYEGCTRMFAPYYRQGAMKIYSLSPEEREPYLLYAYDDIYDSFGYYLENENQGRPIVLAGFSQGADMCYRLLEDYFGDEDLQDRLVAVYAIGWPCTKEMTEEFPQIKSAKGETDTGVVVSFDCEAPGVEDTFITPKGTHALTINPLNWKTDKTPADKSENIGACFTDYDANIKTEINGLCGCYIDEERGVVKIPDVKPEDYPAFVPGLPEGAYHIYDYQFFFRNLEENVAKRVDSYLNKAK